jgi:hypothetical protein
VKFDICSTPDTEVSNAQTTTLTFCMTDHTQRFYQAIAIIQGILSLDGSHPVVTVGDAVFPAYASKVVRRKHQPGQVQNFRVYPCIRHKQPTFQLVNVVDLQPTAIKLNGCWELHKGEPHFAIYRNGVLNPGDHFCRNLVPVVWEDAPPADGQFWQAEAQVRDGAFVVVKADGPFVPPPKSKPSVLESSRDEPRPALPKPKPVAPTAKSPAKPAPTLMAKTEGDAGNRAEQQAVVEPKPAVAATEPRNSAGEEHQVKKKSILARVPLK